MDMHEEDKINYYVNGLIPKLRSQVEVREPQNLEDAIKYSITFDQIQNTSPPYQRPHINNNAWSKPANNYRPQQTVPMEIGTITKNKPGAQKHQETDNYKSKYCSKCKRKGHTDFECRTHPEKLLNTMNDEGNLQLDIPIDQEISLLNQILNGQNGKPNELIILNGTIQNHKARILLDSGARYDYISAAFVEKKLFTH